jgi:hypothetical protein
MWVPRRRRPHDDLAGHFSFDEIPDGDVALVTVAFPEGIDLTDRARTVRCATRC